MRRGYSVRAEFADYTLIYPGHVVTAYPRAHGEIIAHIESGIRAKVHHVAGPVEMHVLPVLRDVYFFGPVFVFSFQAVRARISDEPAVGGIHRYAVVGHVGHRGGVTAGCRRILVEQSGILLIDLFFVDLFDNTAMIVVRVYPSREELLPQAVSRPVIYPDSAVGPYKHFSVNGHTVYPVRVRQNIGYKAFHHGYYFRILCV